MAKRTQTMLVYSIRVSQGSVATWVMVVLIMTILSQFFAK